MRTHLTDNASRKPVLKMSKCSVVKVIYNRNDNELDPHFSIYSIHIVQKIIINKIPLYSARTHLLHTHFFHHQIYCGRRKRRPKFGHRTGNLFFGLFQFALRPLRASIHHHLHALRPTPEAINIIYLRAQSVYNFFILYCCC